MPGAVCWLCCADTVAAVQSHVAKEAFRQRKALDAASVQNEASLGNRKAGEGKVGLIQYLVI